MKFDRGMGTLMTVFSGVAALMCLLVGIQLLLLESRIGQAATQAEAGSVVPFLHWKAQAHTGAVMSLGAGLLIFLFGLRVRMVRDQGETGRDDHGEPTFSADDLDSLSVRVFEIDDADTPIEITLQPEDQGPGDPRTEPKVWAPFAETEPRADDPTDSILRSIEEATSPHSADGSRWSRKSRWSRIFGRRRRG